MGQNRPDLPRFVMHDKVVVIKRQFNDLYPIDQSLRGFRISCTPQIKLSKSSYSC